MIERSAGILLPLSSLPSPHGIGTMGKAAYDFADFLAAARQCAIVHSCFLLIKAALRRIVRQNQYSIKAGFKVKRAK